MGKIKKIIFIGISYVIAFAASVCVSSLVLNQGMGSAVLQVNGSTLPVMYVKTGGMMMNEMHGYKQPVDAGYYRDTLTAVGESKTVNLSITNYGYAIKSARFELYNAQYDNLIEEGECAAFSKVDGGYQMQAVFAEPLKSNCEYNLRIILTDADDQEINYYTRVRYGSDLKVAEKLEFILDFNETTFDKDSASTIAGYLESTSSATSDYSDTTLYSSSDAVTWGSLAPYRTSELSVRLKEINTETASFTLSYTVESSAGDLSTFYEVNEYYRLRWTDEKVYLLDFERQMHEKMNLIDITIQNGQLRIGIGDLEQLKFIAYGTEEQQYGYLVNNDELWMYDSTNRIMTRIYSMDEENHNCGMQEELGVKVVHTDDATGDLYFVAYGYMHSGDFEGQEGVMVYHFNHEMVQLEELVFIPYDKGFEQLDASISKLAYMNDNNELYLMIENTIYNIDTSLGRMETAWEDVANSQCVVSEDGILVMAEDGSDYGGSRLRVINLNTDKTSYIDGKGHLLCPYGFADTHLVYGAIDEAAIAENSQGITCAPASMVYIVDAGLKQVKTYEKQNRYINSVVINPGNIEISLGKAVQNGQYTDYEADGEDYIVRNNTSEASDIEIVSVKDDIRGLQQWIQLGGTSSYQPITQTARYLDPGYDITKNYSPAESLDVCYYVYTKGRMAASFDTIQEAVTYGNANAGTIMTSHKQVAWQRAGRAYIWDLNVDAIDKVGDKGNMNRILLNTIATYEGFSISNLNTISAETPVYAALAENLPVETVDLSGLDLTDVLHFVYRDRMVVVKLSDTNYGIIVAYDNTYVAVADPEKGEITWMTQTAAETQFKEQGSVYYSYFD